MSKDEHRNCSYCPLGYYQPDEITDKPNEVIGCKECPEGTYAEIIAEMKEFNSLPDWLNV